MHYLGQSNFLNPAVQTSCKWFIGLPVLSSVHFNLANSATSFNQLVDRNPGGYSSLNIDEVVRHLGYRTLFTTELHISLLALGYKRDEYYYNFSVTEKLNLPLTLSRDLFNLAWNGNTPFEGDEASSRGTALYFTHYREYAFGISKKVDETTFLGLKAKVLFGKFNISTPKAHMGLSTDPNSFDLDLQSDILLNLSAPVRVDVSNQHINSISPVEPIQPLHYLLNRKNPGLALDAGFIRYPNRKTQISGSVVDLGFIRWRSDVYNLSAQQTVSYQGVLIDSGNVTQSLTDSLAFAITNRPYFTLLPAKLYLGVQRELTPKINVQGLGSLVCYRTKVVPQLTFSADINPFRNLHLVGSYSWMYRSFTNLGLGLSILRNPVQFYLMSDNAWGLLYPMTSRVFNLRFGMNINLGCSNRQEGDRPTHGVSGGSHCPAYANPRERQQRRR